MTSRELLMTSRELLALASYIFFVHKNLEINLAKVNPCSVDFWVMSGTRIKKILIKILGSSLGIMITSGNRYGKMINRIYVP
jgi:hypothetical protein